MTIQISDLSIYVGSRAVVSNLSMTVQDGERVGLIGASGSGKSMIIKAILGLLPLHARVQGSITVDGAELVGLPDSQRAKLRGPYMAMIFQNPAQALNPVVTIENNVLLPLAVRRKLSGLSKEKKKNLAAKALESVGLNPSLADRYPHELSGGQAQRAAIAEAMMDNPRFIAADEPTTAVDTITQKRILDLLMRKVENSGASLLFVTHDFSVLSRIAQRCYVIAQGTLVDQGTITDLLSGHSSDTGQNEQDSRHPITRKLVESAKELAL